MPLRLALLLAASAVEAAPLALIVGLLAAWTPSARADVPTAPTVAAVALAFGLTRLLLRRGVAPRHARPALLLAGVAATLLLYVGPHARDLAHVPPLALAPVLLPALAVGLYAWTRGVVLAREDLAFDAIYASFKRGLVALFPTLALAAATGDAAQPVVAAGWGQVLIFFVAGLCALSLARVEEERRRGAGPEGPPPVRPEWVGTLLGATAAVGLVGLALAALLSPAALALALAPLGRLADLVLWLLTPLILLVGLLIDPLLRFLRARMVHQPAQHQPTARRPRPAQPSVLHLTPQQLVNLERTLLLVAALVVVCVALWYAFSERRRGAIAQDGIEERESLWSWSAFRASLFAAWRRLWARLRRRHHAAGQPIEAAGPSGPRGILSIRALYRRLLAGAALLGLPRRPAETPHEYLARLRVALPQGEKDTALLTGLYARARYGPGTPDASEVAAAGEVWARLEPLLQPPDSATGTRDEA